MTDLIRYVYPHQTLNICNFFFVDFVRFNEAPFIFQSISMTDDKCQQCIISKERILSKCIYFIMFRLFLNWSLLISYLSCYEYCNISPIHYLCLAKFDYLGLLDYCCLKKNLTVIQTDFQKMKLQMQLVSHREKTKQV